MKNKINEIRGTNVFIINGGLHMNDRSIGDIVNAKFGDNANLQGDDVKQINIESNHELDNALNNLIDEINEIKRDEDKDNANMHYEMLSKAIQDNKPSRIKTCLDTLKGIIGVTSSIMTIASEFGISI